MALRNHELHARNDDSRSSHDSVVRSMKSHLSVSDLDLLPIVTHIVLRTAL